MVRRYCFSVLLLAGALACHAAEPSPVGLWKAFDDHTHRARGTVLIFEENGAFFGRIESTFNPAEIAERCRKCAATAKTRL